MLLARLWRIACVGSLWLTLAACMTGPGTGSTDGGHVVVGTTVPPPGARGGAALPDRAPVLPATAANGRAPPQRSVPKDIRTAQADRNVSAHEPGRRCHPSYVGACLPLATDVDCAGGRGDGPVYVRGPIRVVGPDSHRLDRDGDGIACER